MKKLPIFYSALVLTAVNLLLRLVSTSFQVFVSGRIGAAGVGLLQLVLSVGMFANTAATAGIRTTAMYLTAEELRKTMARLTDPFASVRMMMDCYTEFAARASKVKNPINDVGVTQVYGMDDPQILEESGFSFVKEHDMTPADLVEELRGMEKRIFRSIYAGGIAKKMYRLYEYRYGGTAV